MRRYNPFYFIAEALKSLKRNGVMTFASIAVRIHCDRIGTITMIAMYTISMVSHPNAMSSLRVRLRLPQLLRASQ